MYRHWDGKTPLGLLPGLAAKRWPNHIALQFHDQQFSFAALHEKIDSTARGLLAAGVMPGDRVALWLNNCPEWIYLLFALAKIGAIQVPINTRFRSRDAAYVIAQAECGLLITDSQSGPIDYLRMVYEMLGPTSAGIALSEKFPALRQVLVRAPTDARTLPDLDRPGFAPLDGIWSKADDVDADALQKRAEAVNLNDTFLIMYTSGTTGFPKGVMRNHRLLRNQSDRIDALGTSDRDVMYNYLPLFHIFGYVDGPLLSVMTGNKQILIETFEPETCLDAIAADGVTQIHGFETHLKDLIEAQTQKPRDLSSLRAGIFAVGTLSSEPIVQRSVQVLAPLKQITAYGMTEVGANVCISDLHASREQATQTSGKPCPGFHMRVIDPDTGQDQAIGTPGELIVKSYNLMQGYYNNPEATARAYDAEGWFHTGDMGYLREDGYFRFLGRYKDMLKIGGENVDPMEVEGFLLSHPDIHHVAVVSRADARLTEVAVAFVIPRRADLTEEEVLAYCRGQIASFKIPRTVHFVDQFPMTSTGKIQKTKLREEAERQHQLT